VTSLITGMSRVIVLDDPNNPTGAVLPYDEVVVLANGPPRLLFSVT